MHGQRVNDSVSGTLQAGDSIIDGKLLKSTKIEAKLTDSLNNFQLVDVSLAADYERKWLQELYENSLYDTIYKSVEELEYEEVDYPELPTDTLKNRLEKLNAKTPFNIAYNPSLESVIKSYLLELLVYGSLCLPPEKCMGLM